MAKNAKAVKTNANATKAAKQANTQWAIGTEVEHPAHGVGKVTGHTETDGVVIVDFPQLAMVGAEIVADELKLVGNKKVKLQHVRKPSKKQARKESAKRTQAADFGTAQEQHRGYAKLAAKLGKGTRVVSLGDKREGYVDVTSAPGSGYVGVLFDLDSGMTTKHVSDLKEVKISKKDKKWRLGEMVIGKAEGYGELSGEIAALSFTNCMMRIRVGGAAISDWVPFASFKPYADAEAKPVKVEHDSTKFENLPLLSGFRMAKDDRDFVKVGNTSAVTAIVLHEPDAVIGKHLPFVRLAAFGTEGSKVEKIRLKKNAQVQPIVARPLEVQAQQ